MKRVESELDSFWRSDLRSYSSSGSLSGREGLKRSSSSLSHSLERGRTLSDLLREAAAEKPLYNVSSPPRPASARKHGSRKLLSKDTGRDPFGQSFMRKGDCWLNTPSKRVAGASNSPNKASASDKHPGSGHRCGNKTQLSPGLQVLSGEGSQMFSPISATPRSRKHQGAQASSHKKSKGSPHSPSTRLDLYDRGNVTTFGLHDRNFKSSFRSLEEFTSAVDSNNSSEHQGEYIHPKPDKHEEESVEAVEIEEVEDLEHDPAIFPDNGRGSAASRQDIPRSKSENKLWSPIDRSGSPQQISVRETALGALAGVEKTEESPKKAISPGFSPSKSKYSNYMASSRAKTVPNLLRGVHMHSHLGSPSGVKGASTEGDDLALRIQRALETMRDPRATKESIEDVMSTAAGLSSLLRTASFHRQKVDALRRQYQELDIPSSH
eukprot:gb/GECG01004894.1/.p1 GENE.gb/GECG01004894.1/~~gb/GECG01004894.1/.p1  ORF type:complete len:437 (+),score=53.77 gb/GECG01004894.1/:1-1311(+)